MKPITTVALATLFSFAMAGSGLTAGDAGVLPPVVARYEQMLVRSPEKGAAFDKVYQHFFEGEGIEKLSQRWSEGAKGSESAVAYHLLLGLLAERQRVPKEARKSYTQAAELAPGDYRAWQALGELEASEGQMTAAIVALQKALGATPPETVKAVLYRKLAQSHQRDLNAAAALATWQMMAKDFPDDPFVLEEVAEALVDAERYDDAKATYQKLRDLAGSDPFKKVSATMRLAQVEERQGKIKEALAIYESALPQASATSWIHREVRTRIEEIYRRQDDLPGLVTYYEHWLAEHDKDGEVATRLSNVLVELNRRDDAVGWLKKAAEWAPDRREVQVELAKGLRATGKAEEAIQLLAALTQSFPEELSYWEMRGEAEWSYYEQTKEAAQKTAALASWQKLAPADTKDAGRVSRLADLLKTHDLHDEALAEYARASALAPEASDLRERWATFLFEIKREEDGWKVLNGLVAGERATASNYHRLAVLQKRFGKLEEALQSVQKGRALAPDDFPLLSLQWRLHTDRSEWKEAAALYEPMLNAAPTMYEQVESQYLQVLRSLETVDEVQKALLAKLGDAKESELRLLMRIGLQGEDLSSVRAAMAEGHKRFPDSLSLAKMEAEVERRAEDPEPRVAVLRRLIKLEPKQTNEFLRSIARTYQEKQAWEKALAVAQEWIDASPANADAYLFCADLNFAAQKHKEGVARLHQAIKLSDKPNVIRQRLARGHAEQGEVELARQVCEEAFDAEEDAGAKLQLMRQLSEYYMQTGKSEALIARFKERQRAEEGGWRYALYLAEIYQQMQDFGQAREELAKALASRPKDPSLLKQLLSLADREDNQAERLRYTKVIAEVEPSVANRIAWAEALADSEEKAAAVEVMLANQAEVLQDPAAWRNLFIALKDEDGAKKLMKALEQALLLRPEDFVSRRTLAEMLISINQLDAADRILAALRRMEPPAPAAAAPNAGAGPAVGTSRFTGAGVFGMTGPQQRIQKAQQAQYFFEQLLNSANLSRHFNRSMRMMGGQSSAFTSGAGSFEEVADVALIYRAAIAVRQGQSDRFLAELEKELTETKADLNRRIVTYAMLQATEPLAKAVAEYAGGPGGSSEMDEMCWALIRQFTTQPGSLSEPLKRELNEGRAKLTQRLSKGDQQRAVMFLFEELGDLKRQGKKDEMRKLGDEWLTKFDAGAFNGGQFLSMAINLAAEMGELERAEAYARKVVTGGNPASQWGLYSLGQAYLKEKDLKNGVRLLVESYKIWLDAKGAGAKTLSGTISLSHYRQRGGARFVRNYGVPYPNRFIDEMQSQLLQQAVMQLKPLDGVPSFLAALEKEIVPEDKAIHIGLIGAYAKWWEGAREEAVKEVVKLIAGQPDNELRLLLAGMQGEIGQHKEAIETLKGVTEKQGDLYVQTQVLLLEFAKQINDDATAREALGYILALRPNRNELQYLEYDIKRLGLADKAGPGQRPAVVPPTRVLQGAERTVQLLEQYRQEKKETEAVGLARSVLMQDPLLKRDRRTDEARRVALNVLSDFKALAPYIAELEKEVVAKPDTVRLYLQLAEAVRRGDSKKTVEWLQKAIALKPSDIGFKLFVASALEGTDKADEAIRLFSEALSETPGLIFDDQYRFYDLFQRAKKLPVLAAILLEQTEVPGNSQNMYRMTQLVMQLGGGLQAAGDPELAVKVWQKGIELLATLPMNLRSGADVGLRASLVKALVDLGRGEEACEQVELLFFPLTPAKQTLLGGGMQSHSQGQAHWMSISSNNQGKITNPALEALRATAGKGGIERVLKLAEKGAEGDPSKEALVVLLRVMAHDPKAPEAVAKLLASSSANPNGYWERAMLNHISQELEDWPEAAELSLKVLQAIRSQADGNLHDYGGRLMSYSNLAKRALELGKLDLAKGAVRDWENLLKGSGNNYNDYEQMREMIRLTVKAGLSEEADSILAIIKKKNTSEYELKRIVRMEGDLALAKGAAPNPQILAVPDSGENGKTVVLWGLRNGSRGDGNERERLDITATPFPKLDKRYDIELLYMTPPNRVQRLAMIPKANAWGQWTGKLPEGEGAIQAVLHGDGGKSYAGIWVPVLAGSNLLFNPTLQGIKERAANTSIAGWEQIPSGKWSIEPGGPRPGGSMIVCKRTDSSTAVLSSEKIPVERGKRYFQSAWSLSGQRVEVGVRFYDTAGKEVGRSQVNVQGEEGLSEKWVLLQQTLTTSKKQRYNEDRRIGDNVAFLQFYVQMEGGATLASLYLGAVSTPEEVAAAPAQVSVSGTGSTPATATPASPTPAKAVDQVASGDPQIVVGLFDPDPALKGAKNADAKLFWEIAPFITAVRTEITGKNHLEYDNRYDLEIRYMVPPEAPQRIALIPKVKSRGSWSGKLPSGLGTIQAVLRSSDGKVYAGPNTTVLPGPNLLSNPGVNGAVERAASGGTEPVAGWAFLPEGGWSTSQDGARPNGHYVSFIAQGKVKTEMVGEKVPVAEAKDYFQSAWFQGEPKVTPQLGRRYLDKEGNELRTDFAPFPGGKAIHWRYYSSRIYASNTEMPPSNILPMPSGTAFIQPVIKVRGNFSMEGLYLGEVPATGDYTSDQRLRMLMIEKEMANQKPQDYWGRMNAELRMAEGALALGRMELVKNALKDWMIAAQAGKKIRSAHNPQVLKLMIDAGMLEEAQSVIDMVKGSNPDDYEMQRMASVEGEVAMLKGVVINPQALAMAGGEEEGKNVIFWGLHNATHSMDERGVLSLSGRAYPKLDKRFDIELLYRTQPNRVQRLAMIPKAKTLGKWIGRLPEGEGDIQAVLHGEGGKTYAGVWVPVQRGKNLLANPDFKGLKAGAADLVIPGWERLPAGRWSVDAGGPRLGGSAIVYKRGGQTKDELRSEMIPIESGKVYFQSGWCSTTQQVQIGVRLYDANGKEVRNCQCNHYGGNDSMKWTYYHQTLMSLEVRGRDEKEIPKEAVSLQYYIKLNSDGAVTGLFLGAEAVPTKPGE